MPQQEDEIPLMRNNFLLHLPSKRMPHVLELPVFDLWGSNVEKAYLLGVRGRNSFKALWGCGSSYSAMSDFNAFNLFGCPRRHTSPVINVPPLS